MEGQYDTAVKGFQAALDAEPTSDSAYRGLARAYESLGNLAEAERIYRQAVALRPHYWAGYNWLGAFLFGQARYQEAAEMFRMVTNIAPENVRGWYNLGGTYVLDGRYEQAIEVLERAVKLRPSASALSNLGTAYFYRREFARAAERYAAAVELAPQDSSLWVNLAEARYWIPEQREQALDAARKALSFAQQELKVNPKDAGVLARVALCHAIAGEARPSREALRQALEQAPADTEVVVRAAQAESLLADHDRALELVQKALQLGVRAATIDNDPMFDALRKDARFAKTLSQAKAK
jgi:tetratricopeptide (TPR) repeat protein